MPPWPLWACAPVSLTCWGALGYVFGKVSVPCGRPAGRKCLYVRELGRNWLPYSSENAGCFQLFYRPARGSPTPSFCTHKNSPISSLWPAVLCRVLTHVLQETTTKWASQFAENAALWLVRFLLHMPLHSRVSDAKFHEPLKSQRNRLRIRRSAP